MAKTGRNFSISSRRTVIYPARPFGSDMIGTLDAMHLATALLIRDPVGLDTFITHDTQLGFDK